MSDPLSLADGVVTLSVLFTDLVASTELFSAIGDEAADAVRTRHFTTMRSAVDGNGGRDVKGLGDGMMAVFPSAAAAVACAVAMQEGMHRRRPRAGDGMHIRVGISSGDVSVIDGDCFGEAVTEASRLCAVAGADQVLVSDALRVLLRGRGGHHLIGLGPVALKGLPDPVETWQVEWQKHPTRRLRAILADDSTLVREGIARLLEECGIDVVAQVGDGAELVRAVELNRPDIAITDIRMPPTHTLEGLDAAEHIRRSHPAIAVLVLSQHLDRSCARRLIRSADGSVGYLLKDRVGDIDEFVDAVRQVAAGSTVLDPELGDRDSLIGSS